MPVVQLDVHRSQFVDWQRVRVQENPEEIPPGRYSPCAPSCSCVCVCVCVLALL
jgi:DNA replicative helicase MCM subunit Mcm2 (Cdc46/Mcm family)